MNGVFDHPLGIRQSPGGTQVLDEYETILLDPKEQLIQSLPTSHGRHVWAARVIHRVSVTVSKDHNCGRPTCTGQLVASVDPRPLLNSPGIRCLVCTEEADVDNIGSRCPGRPDGQFTPTQAQFRNDWTEDERVAWLTQTYGSDDEFH